MASREVEVHRPDVVLPRKPMQLTWKSSADIPELEVDDLAGETEESLVARGAAYAREMVRVESVSTILKRNTAVVLVALRKELGDWTGETHEYRTLVKEMYTLAGVPSGPEGDSFKAAIRYHVGNTLRRHLTPRELKKTGLLPESPLERSQDVRATNKALVRAIKVGNSTEKVPAKKAAGRRPTAQGAANEDVVQKAAVVRTVTVGNRIKATADHLRLAEVASGLVGQMSTGVIDDDMTDGQRVKLDERLAEMERTICQLRRHLKTHRSED